MREDAGDVTALLARMRNGDAEAESNIIRLLQRELREVAARMLANEKPGHTLRPSDLVQEAFLQVLGRKQNNWENRRHLIRSMSRRMRNVLIDHGRRYQTAKHNKPQQFDSVNDKIGLSGIPGLTANVGVTPEDLERLIPINEAIQAMEGQHPRQAEVIQLQVFGDLSDREIAEVLGIAEKTVLRDKDFARAWISRFLRRNE